MTKFVWMWRASAPGDGTLAGTHGDFAALDAIKTRTRPLRTTVVVLEQPSIVVQSVPSDAPLLYVTVAVSADDDIRIRPSVEPVQASELIDVVPAGGDGQGVRPVRAGDRIAPVAGRAGLDLVEVS